ncbi:hypothetical protein VULLAG_LOCUS19493 [Vulpes lagopus]
MVSNLAPFPCHRVSSGMTSSVHLLVFKDHLSMPRCCQEDSMNSDPWMAPAYQAATGRDPHPEDEDDEG